MRKGLYGSFSVRVLIVAMSVVATAFVSIVIYFEASTMRMQRETVGMLNDVPALDRLKEARATLRGLDGVVAKALFDAMEHRAVDDAQLRGALRNLWQDIASYRSLPDYELESELNRRLDGELRALDAVEQRLVHLLARNEVSSALALENGEWRRRSDDVDGELRALISFNLRHVTRHAAQLDRVRRTSAIVGIGVGAGGVMLALAATIVAVRAVRRQTLLQEERARELELFSARVAHDLMSPLQPVALALEVAADELRDAAAGKLVCRARASLKRVRLIVDGLLEFARAGGHTADGARAPVGKVLGEVVDDARTGAERAGIEVRLEPPPVVDVACPPGVLSVIIGNLVSNAIKYMGDSRTRVVTLRARAQARGVCFEVEDTGPGVPDGLGHKVFEPYVRGHATVGGLGLGLATVKRFVDAHGGRVGVRHGNPCGSIFWFELPRA